MKSLGIYPAKIVLHGIIRGVQNVFTKPNSNNSANDDESSQKNLVDAALTNFAEGFFDGVTLEAGTEAIGNLIESITPQENKVVFEELSTRTVETAKDFLGKSRLDFIFSECMKKKEACKSPKFTTLTDSTKSFVAKCEFLKPISVEKANDLGFILPPNIEKEVAKNPRLKIKPLMIHCYGVTSGDTLNQLAAATNVLLDRTPEVIRESNTLVKKHIQREVQNNKTPDTIVVPFITGHSLGGAFANIIAAKNNIGSIVFNPLGLNEEMCNFIGQKAWSKANKEHANQHLGISVEGDFTSSEESIISLKKLFNMKYPGQMIRIPKGSARNAYEIHTDHQKIFSEIMGSAYA